MDIEFDFSGLFSDLLGEGRGLSGGEVEGIAGKAKETWERMMELREGGGLAFYGLPEAGLKDETLFETGRKIKGEFSDMAVLGIGGSALGAKAIHSALGGEGARLHIADNIDPFTFSSLIDSLPLKETLFNVISKSGTTAETVAQFILARRALQERLGSKWRGHILITTDPEKGFLRRIAREEGIDTIDIPPPLGGRFSVLSAVGLLPAIASGVDGREVLEGALSMKSFCSSPEVAKNPSILNGAAHYLAMTGHGISICVMMSYCDRLLTFAEWFKQLWAESLGKRRVEGGRVANTGQTPTGAVGVTDQHSLLQLYMDGPHDKMVTFIEVNDPGRDMTFEPPPGEVENSYLRGKSLGSLFLSEKVGTEMALTEAGRMNLTLKIPSVTPFVLGELFFFYELSTAFTGILMGIDPFDQPAVEKGKVYSRLLMGKGGEIEVRNSLRSLRERKERSKREPFRYFKEDK